MLSPSRLFPAQTLGGKPTTNLPGHRCPMAWGGCLTVNLSSKSSPGMELSRSRLDKQSCLVRSYNRERFEDSLLSSAVCVCVCVCVCVRACVCVLFLSFLSGWLVGWLFFPRLCTKRRKKKARRPPSRQILHVETVDLPAWSVPLVWADRK